MSDLHVEFHADHGAALIGEVVSGLTPADVLVVAGDLADSAHLPAALDLLAQSPAPIVYVTGNHEFYGADRATVTAQIHAAAGQHPHLHWLDHAAIELGGVRFLGTPLWFREHPGAPKWAMNDFTQIRRYTTWVYEENRRATEFLREHLRAGDVVVTHHLPHQRSVARQYARSALNPFFLCDQSSLVRARQPALLCNPFGYVGYEPTGAWRPLDLDVAPCE